MDIWAEEHPYYWSGNPVFDARTELKWRLNQSIQGINPGKPVNWKGL